MLLKRFIVLGALSECTRTAKWNLNRYLSYTQISVVIQRFTTSEDVCWNIRNVKVRPFFFPEMRSYFLMFITAVCFLFLLKMESICFIHCFHIGYLAQNYTFFKKILRIDDTISFPEAAFLLVSTKCTRALGKRLSDDTNSSTLFNSSLLSRQLSSNEHNLYNLLPTQLHSHS